MKRLELRLPDNHPIFNFPVRSRSLAAVTFLDIGMKLAHIESKLDSIESKLENAIVKKEEPDPGGYTSEEKKQITQNILDAFG